jgi:hypothetical protein
MKDQKMKFSKVEIAAALIILGVVIRVALAGYANIEPILVLSMMAGLVLGGWYALVVPLLMMVLSDWAVYALGFGDVFGWNIIIGIVFFTWTGMMMAGVAGRMVKPKFLFRLKGVGVFTGAALVMTVIFDLWTMVGYMFVMDRPLYVVLAGQVTFSIYHILSTLIFAPLFGTMYIYIHEYGIPSILPRRSGAKVPGEEK